MNSVILIPARYGSSRFPGKPLAELKGAEGEQAADPPQRRCCAPGCRHVGRFVTTDDERIADACTRYGVGVIMTSADCRNGTERCAEAVKQLHDAELVINFQGDALLTPPALSRR